MRKVVSIMFVGVLVASLSGCARVERGMSTRAHASQMYGGRKVLVGIDVTGSYALLPQALPLAAEFFMMNAMPGDTWTFRWIERDSYSDRAAIPVFKGKSSVLLPSLRKPSNPFDKRAKLKYLLGVKEVNAIKTQVARNLRALRRQQVRGTDIWGFLAKAQDLKVSDVVMFTDLGDTMRNELPLKLDGIRVWILGFQSGKNPREAAKRRAYWTNVLKRAGVSEIFFFDFTQPLPRWNEGGEF
ncbi:hypothetical protein [Fervidibacter sacchari]